MFDCDKKFVMDLSLIIFLAIVGYFAYSGYKSGFFSVLSGVISIPTAYVVTIFYTQDFARWLKNFSAFEGLIAYLAGGAILFTLTALFLTILFAIIKKLIIRPEHKDSPIIAVTGGLLGAMVGVFIGVLTIWFSSTVTDLLSDQIADSAPEKSGFSEKVQTMTGNTINNIANKLSDNDTVSEITTSLITNPGEQIKRFNRVTNRGYFQEMIYSNKARDALDSRNAAELFETPAFKKLVNDNDFRTLASDLNVSEDPDELDKQVAIKITQVWAQIDSVKHQPRFKALTQDPEVSEMINQRNVFKLMNSAKIEELLNVIASVETPEVIFEPLKKVEEKQVEIYRWVDGKGRVHYSDKKKEQN